MERRKIDLTKANTVLEGTKDKRDAAKKLVLEYVRNLTPDQVERKKINDIRQDFILGNQSSYTNIIGLQKKEKKGHANATYNYAGKTCIKIYYGLANNPPSIKIPGLPVSPESFKIEAIRAQAVEDFQDHVLYLNKFRYHTFPRAVMNQISTGAGAISVYYEPKEKMIKVVQKEKMDNLLVGWRGDDAASFDFVIEREERTIMSVEREFGIKVLSGAFETDEMGGTQGSHEAGGEYGTRSKTSTQAQSIPSGKTQLPKCWVTNYWDDRKNIILVNDEIIQYVEHDWGFNPWVLIPNMHIPGKPWGMSDVDFLIDPQIEYNEASNEERDFIRAAANQKFVAKNMDDFDAESVKAGSVQVIYISGDDADFYTLGQQVNLFPSESYLNRTKKAIHDLGVPEVAYGTAGGDSGRSKAIDYQSLVDVIQDKRNAWELAINEICMRIQILGYKYFKKDFFLNPESKEFEPRPVELDWDDVVPLTSSEKVTNVINKYQGGLISLDTAIKELGYKDVDAEIEKMRQEEQDPELAVIRHKVVQLIPGVQAATMEQMQTQQEMMTGGAGVGEEQGAPTLTSGQNNPEEALPMAQAGSSTSFSSPKGFIDRTRQNLNEAGRQ